MNEQKQPITVPPVAELRQRLSEAMREANLLRRLLRVAEHVDRVAVKKTGKAVRHAR